MTQNYNKYGFDLVYGMECLGNVRDVACGKIGIVFVAREMRKVVAVLEAFLLRAVKLKLL